jgi:hypothetical protein
MNKLRIGLVIAGLGVLGFLLAFVLHSQGWSSATVGGVLYGTVFMVGFLSCWTGVGAIKKFNVWQSAIVGGAGALLAYVARR